MSKGKFERKPESRHSLFGAPASEPVQKPEPRRRAGTHPPTDDGLTLSLNAQTKPKRPAASQTADLDGLYLSFEAKHQEPTAAKTTVPKPEKPAVTQSPEPDGLSLSFEAEPREPAMRKAAAPQPERTIPRSMEGLSIQHSPKPMSQLRKQPVPEEAVYAAAEEKQTKKRWSPLVLLSFMKNLLVWAIALLAIGMMIFTIVSVTTLDRSDRTLLGYRAFIVLSDSMKATDFDAGDVVLVKSVDPTTLQPGDIISFTSQNSANYGQTVTHKIRQKTTDVNGDPAFVTYGTTTDVDDETVVPYSHILGKYQFSLPKLGFFFQFLRTGPGYILFILVPFGLLIAYQGIQSVRLFRQGKKEEMDKLEAERAQVAAEREETRRMLEELRRMQNQMTRPPDAQT